MNKSPMDLAKEVIKAMKKESDPLGSYSANPKDTEIPTQDQDDL